MGFNKRIFNAEMLLEHHLEDRKNGVSRAIGKTDGFLFEDDVSRKVIEMWLKGERKEARKLLDNMKKESHVLRIAS